MVMQPQLGNSIKSSRLLLEVISAFGAEDTRTFEIKAESCSKDWSSTWQVLVIGCRARYEATGDNHIPKNGGGMINQHVVRGVLIGLVQFYPGKFGKYVNFEVTRSWARSLYQ